MSMIAAARSIRPPRSPPRRSNRARCRLPTSRSASVRSANSPRSVSRAASSGVTLGGVDLGRQVEDEAEVPLEDVERLDAAHRAVAGNDHVRLEAAQPGERLERALDRSHHDERGPAVEHQIAGEQDLALGQPGDDVVRRVRRGADVVQLDLGVVGPHVDVLVEREHRRRQLAGRPQSGDVEDAVVVTDPGLDDHLPAAGVADDRRRVGQVVAVGVVAVVVGVDEHADRLRRHPGDGVEERPGAALRGAAVDGDDAVGAR